MGFIILSWLLIGGLAFTPLAAGISAAMALGTMWFWSVFAAVCIALFVFIDDDEGTEASGVLFSFALLLQLFGDFKPFSYLYHHPLATLQWAIVYLALGSLWSIAKWWFYVTKQRDHYNDKRRKFLREEGVKGDEIPSNLKYRWTNLAPAKPDIYKEKQRVVRWMSFWPWSMVWTLINDPVKKFFNAVYRRMQGLLQKIADRAFAGTEHDLV